MDEIRHDEGLTMDSLQLNDLQQLSNALESCYLLLASLLVMLMIFGLMMSQVGMIRTKNSVDTLVKNFAIFAITSIIYLLAGYSFMHGHVSHESAYFPALTFGEKALRYFLPGDKPSHHFAGAFFQTLLACVTVSIVAGSVVERMKPWVLSILAIVMAVIIYPLQGYWAWGGGFLSQLGFKDMAGSGVVYLCGAMAGLACLVILGPRQGRYNSDNKCQPLKGGNLPIAAIGVGLVWLGSFGFNTGFHIDVMSSPSGTLGTIFMNTQMAAASGLLSALILSRLFWGKADLTIALNGAVAGLVAIAASPLSPSIYWSLLIGAVAGVFCVLSIVLLNRTKIDDPVGVISVHGSAAVWGLIAVVFTEHYVLSPGEYSLWMKQLFAQLTGIVVISAWSFFTTLLVLWIISKIADLRLPEQDECRGLDQSIYGMQAYPEFK
jgi:Amt family ammonium transporter